MNTARVSHRPETDGYAKDLDCDIANLFLFTQGRVAFGTGTNGGRGENISGEFRTFTTSTANTEVVVPHTLNAIPVGRIVIGLNAGGVLYDSGTPWTKNNVYVKCTTVNTTIKLFLLK